MKMDKKQKFELGQHVQAKEDFPIFRYGGPYGERGIKIADIKKGEKAIVTGYDANRTIFHVVKYQLFVTIEDMMWERINKICD